MNKEFLNLPLSQLKPYKNNPRRITKEAVDAVIASIKDCGELDPIEIDETNTILSGHTRLKALKKLGVKTADVVRYTGLTDEQKQKYRILANKSGEFSQWDEDKLKTELEGLSFDFDFGFDPVEPEDEPDDFDLLPKRLRHNTFENFDNEFTPVYVGKYDIPEMEVTHTTGDEFLRFCDWREQGDKSKQIAHFNYDDFKFISAWREPDKYVDRLREFKAVVAPNFSLYTDFPMVLQILSCYRRQWVGAYWQSLGLDVIPSVLWGDESTYDFCFDGVPSGGTVCVNAVGVTNDKDWNGKHGELFRMGYNAMMERVKPETVLYYGTMLDGIEGNIIRIPSYYEQNRGDW